MTESIRHTECQNLIRASVEAYTKRFNHPPPALVTREFHIDQRLITNKTPSDYAHCLEMMRDRYERMQAAFWESEPQYWD